MPIMVHEDWRQVGVSPAGNPIKAAPVFSNKQMVGRIIDLGNGGYVAEYISLEGEPSEVYCDCYYSAVLRVAENAWMKQKQLN